MRRILILLLIALSMLSVGCSYMPEPCSTPTAPCAWPTPLITLPQPLTPPANANPCWPDKQVCDNSGLNGGRVCACY